MNRFISTGRVRSLRMLTAAWLPLTFGKHRGRTLPQVLFKDADWFFHAFESGRFENGPLVEEAKKIAHRARTIRIPPSRSGRRRVAEYYIHPSGRFDNMKLVPANRLQHAGASLTIRKDRIDLGVPREISGGRMDKTGATRLVSDMRAYLFPPGVVMSRARCERFFDERSNFC